MLTQLRMNKGFTRVEKFRQVRQNAVVQAEARVQKLQDMILKDFKNTEKIKKQREEDKEVENMRKSKYEGKLRMAKLNFEGIMKDVDRRSASGYN